MSDDRRPGDEATTEAVELAQLAELARRGRAALDDVEPAALAAVWADVADALDDDAATASRPPDGATAALRPASAAPAGPGRRATVLAAAAGLVAGLALGAVLVPQLAARDTTVASVELAALDERYEPVEASLARRSGERVVLVTLDDLPTTDGFHEVWLLDEEGGGLVSLGPVRGDGTYVVPDGVDLVGVPTLDVSAEADDGDPGHGGASVLRGTFTW